MKLFGCKHVFSEVKDGYQYCKICGIAIAAPAQKLVFQDNEKLTWSKPEACDQV